MEETVDIEKGICSEEIQNRVIELLSKEESNITEAKNYFDVFDQTDSFDLDDVEVLVQDFLDEYISLADALKIIDELNKYIRAEENFEHEFEVKYGKNTKKYKEIFEVIQYARCTSPKVESIWEMKQYSRRYFNKILKIATRENTEVMKSLALVRTAFLRFYIQNVFRAIKEVSLASQDSLVYMAKYAINLGIALHQIEFFSEFSDEQKLKIFHTIGARANKKKRDSERNKEISDIAKEAWDYGCELLHTQMLLLFMLTGKIDPSKEASAKNTLKKIAPPSRIYGSGAHKTIDTCPCNKEQGCPLLQKISMPKRLDLPATKKCIKAK
jgi:hypothetical protein